MSITYPSGGGGGSGTVAGTTGRIAKFTAATVAGNSIMTEAGTVISVAGQVSAALLDTGGQVYNVQAAAYGAKGDWRTVTDGVIATSGNHVTSATAAFTQADVGKYISVSGARTGSLWLTTTIATVTGATTCTLTVAPTVAVGSGATVDIATDDTTAIQAAINAVPATGGNVLLPTGTYLITQMLQMTTGVQLYGISPALTTIKVANAYNPTLPTTGPSVWYGPSAIVSKPTAGATSNMGIYNLTIDHNLLLQGSWRWFPSAGGGTGGANTASTNLGNAHTIDFRYSQSFIAIQNVKIRNPARYAVHILDGSDLIVRNCDIQSGQNGASGFTNTVDYNNTTQTSVNVNQQDGIHLDNTHRVDVGFNTINTAGLTPTVTPFGYNLGGDDCIALLNYTGLSGNTNDVNIHHNIITSGQNGVGLYEQNGVTCQNINVHDNILVQSVYTFVNMGHYGSSNIALKNISITNNEIRAPFKYDVNTTSGVIYSVRNLTATAFDVDGLIINGNTIDGSGMSATQASGAQWFGIYVERVHNVVITNNEVTNWTGNAPMQVNSIGGATGGGQISDYVIGNNLFDGSASQAGSHGIVLYAGIRGTISGNTVKGMGATAGTGILIGGTGQQTQDMSGQYNVVVGNLCHNFATGYAESNLGGTGTPSNNTFVANLTPSCTTVSSLIGGNGSEEVTTGTGYFKLNVPVNASNLDNNGIYFPPQGVGIAAFTQAASTTYYQYLGKAKKAYASAVVRLNVTTAGVTLSFAEVGIFKGSIVTPGTIPQLTKVATAAATLTAIAKVNTTVTLTGLVNPGDDLWVVVGVGTQGTAVQYTATVADTLSNGVTASNAQRPSTATTTTPAVLATVIPAMVVQFA